MNNGQVRNDLIAWLLVDGLGLCLITACTILDTAYTFNQYLLNPLLQEEEVIGNIFYADGLIAASIFWLSGRFFQVVGLLLLILYAVTFNYSVELDRAGMLFLTIGPLLNIGACALLGAIRFEASEQLICAGQVGEILLRPCWVCTEVVEIIGILWLDISMIDGLNELYVMVAEIIGFLVLIAAAQFEYFFQADSIYPIVVIRADMMHFCDSIGLCLLIFVSIAHYSSKIKTIRTHRSAQHNSKVTHEVEDTLPMMLGIT